MGGISHRRNDTPAAATAAHDSTRRSSSAAPVRFALTVASAWSAETLTYPIDTTKTLLQLQGEHGQGGTRQGSLRLAYSVAQQRGVAALWRGLPPALARHAIYTPIRISVYEYLRSVVRERQGHDALSPAALAVMGGVAGMIGQFVASPADLVKVRMQSSVRQPASCTVGGSGGGSVRMWDVFRVALAERGFVGLWRGVVPNVARAGIINLGELSTYDAFKRFVISTGWVGDTPVAHVAASLASGLVSAAVGTPADVLKTRLMNQRPVGPPTPAYASGSAAAAVPPMYRGVLDCLVRTVRAEGVGALWKGFVPLWARLAPWQLTFWVSYEALRRWAGLGTF